jgi:predicted RNase H-like HicB family nuclease
MEPAYTTTMLVRYIDTALRRARYRHMEDDSFCATVPGLRGVVALGRTVEACRDQLAEVVEEWVLIRVARGLKVPPLGRVRVEIKQAS